MGLIKFFQELFGGKKAEVCEVEVPTAKVVETKKVEVPTAKVAETKKEVVKQEVPVQAEETKVTAKEIKAKRRRPAKKTEEVKEVVATEEAVVKAKPRRRRKPKAKPENGDQA